MISIGHALRSPRYLLSAWPWRSAAYLATSAILLMALTAPVSLAVLPLVGPTGPDPRGPVEILLSALAGALFTAGLLTAIATPVARLDLLRARLVDARPLPSFAEPAEAGPRWRRRLTDRAAWLRVLYVVVTCAVGPAGLLLVLVAALLSVILLAAPLLVRWGPLTFWTLVVDTGAEAWWTVPVGVAGLALTGYLGGLVSAGQLALTRLLLVDPTGPLEHRLIELTRARTRLVHDFDAERRRIERDLHDGAQQRLVSLTVHLGLARMDAERELGGDHRVTREVSQAHDQAKQFMVELRAFIRGIHPQALSDLGVGAALEHVAATAPLPVTVRNELGTRLDPAVETTVYFCVVEALTNAVRHAGADRVEVTLRHDGDAVVADVLDHGRGGADRRRGTGLSGMADRAAVLLGTVSVSSPPGGPTLVRIRIPVRPAPEGPAR